MCEAVENYGMRKQVEALIQLGRLKNLTDDQIIDDIVAVCHIAKEKAAEYLGLKMA